MRRDGAAGLALVRRSCLRGRGLRPLADRRDRALLCLGWQAALRRAEIVALDWRDLRAVGAAAMIALRGSKTAPGETIEIPIVQARDARFCPVRALDALRRGSTAGPVFRRAGRRERLSAQSVTLILRRRMEAAGLDPAGYSAHSLRFGFLTSAAAHGASLHRLMEHSRHRRSETLDIYIRDSRLIESHPAEGLL